MVASAVASPDLTKCPAEDSAWNIASISPRVSASAAWFDPLYPATTWQSICNATQVKAAPMARPELTPDAAQRHFSLCASACAMVLIFEFGSTSQTDGGAPTVAR